MDIEIVHSPYHVELYGCSGTIEHANPAATGFALMDKMWKEIKAHGWQNKGINIWVYGPGNQLFTGVELISDPGVTTLERMSVWLPGYARYKHIGPYRLLGEVYEQFVGELRARNLTFSTPYLEIYGHYSANEHECETEVLMQIA